MRFIKDRGEGYNLVRISIEGNEHINFSSNDYLGLATNRLLMSAAKKAMERYGSGSGASRLLSGGTELHKELENELAKFKGTESALIFNSGYTANVSAIPSIAREGDVIFSDELNHASIIDGCKLSRAKKIVYRHRDVEHLSELIKKEKGNKKIVITDSVFSMDGDIAPLRKIYELCHYLNSKLQPPNSILLYIDDAHGTGVLGGGAGVLKHFNINPEPWTIQMGTFSKALGSYGGFIAATEDIIGWLINTARGFIYSTALPACVTAASAAALHLLQKDNSLLEKLSQNRDRLFNDIKNLGFDTLQSETPIIPIVVGNTEQTLKFSDALRNKRIYAPAIRPPTTKVPRIRITVTAAHDEEDINRLLDALSFAK
ncbi:MAG: 8-amino-7-oxononanoate synthase [Thermodesulfovibrionales bacterium]|nr:8-amino-7-oxononanoate synthase [Thermodesulfovibrionales bacterium]